MSVLGMLVGRAAADGSGDAPLVDRKCESRTNVSGSLSAAAGINGHLEVSSATSEMFIQFFSTLFPFSCNLDARRLLAAFPSNGGTEQCNIPMFR